MSPAAAEELRLCYAANALEVGLAAEAPRRFNAEAFQRALWRHREAIIQQVVDREAMDLMLEDLLAALRPFARAASILPPGVNPVLISLPSPADDGHTFVQLRPEHFRRAAELTGTAS